MDIVIITTQIVQRLLAHQRNTMREDAHATRHCIVSPRKRLASPHNGWLSDLSR